jgi:acyl-CoA reductase-like NAD-dependent aldehyde dehydrogenase
VLLEVIGDLLPPGVLNVVQGYGREAGEALATSKRIAKIAFTGSTPVGSHIMKCAAENIIPSTVELGGKSPNIFFEDIMPSQASSKRPPKAWCWRSSTRAKCAPARRARWWSRSTRSSWKW